MRRLLTFVIILTSLSLSPLWAEESRFVEIKELGFRIHKPADWHFFQELTTPLDQDKPTLQSLLSHYAKTPAIAISKFPADYEKDINPNIRVTLKPVINTAKKKEVDAKDPEHLLRGIVTSLNPVLPNMKINEDVQVLTISGFHTAFVSISYTMLLNDGSQTRGNSDIWLVMPRDDYIFLISGVTRADQRNATRDDLQAVVETITIQALES